MHKLFNIVDKKLFTGNSFAFKEVLKSCMDKEFDIIQKQK